MKIIHLFRIMMFACALCLPELAMAETEPDKGEKMMIESKRKMLVSQLELLNQEREKLLKQNMPTDTIDLKIEFAQEDLDVLATGRVETKEERLKRDLARYKRLREHNLKKGKSTEADDKLIKLTEDRLKSAVTAQKDVEKTEDKIRQAKIEHLKRSISTLEASIDRRRKTGKPVPQGLLDSKAKKEAELAELEK